MRTAACHGRLLEKNPGTDLLTISLGITAFFYGALLVYSQWDCGRGGRGATLSNLTGVGGQYRGEREQNRSYAVRHPTGMAGDLEMWTRLSE